MNHDKDTDEMVDEAFDRLKRLEGGTTAWEEERAHIVRLFRISRLVTSLSAKTALLAQQEAHKND